MPRIDDYQASRALAVAELQKVNPQRLAGLSRCEYFYEDTREWLIVPFFGQERLVLWPEVSVTPGDGQGEVPLTEQILILHYLVNTTGEPLSGRDIDFRQRAGGRFLLVHVRLPGQKTLAGDLRPRPGPLPPGGRGPGGHSRDPGRRLRHLPGLPPGARHPCPLAGG